MCLAIVYPGYSKVFLRSFAVTQDHHVNEELILCPSGTSMTSFLFVRYQLLRVKVAVDLFRQHSSQQFPHRLEAGNGLEFISDIPKKGIFHAKDRSFFRN